MAMGRAYLAFSEQQPGALRDPLLRPPPARRQGTGRRPRPGLRRPRRPAAGAHPGAGRATPRTSSRSSIWSSLHGYAMLRTVRPHMDWPEPDDLPPPPPRRPTRANCDALPAHRSARTRLVRHSGSRRPSAYARRKQDLDRVEHDKVDARCARLAAEQWSVLDVADLRACGLSARGHLHGASPTAASSRSYRGVYGVIPNLTLEGAVPRGRRRVRAGRGALALLAPRCLYGWFDWDGRFPEVTATNRAGTRRHLLTPLQADRARGLSRHSDHATGPDAHRISRGKLPYAGVRARRQRGAEPRAGEGQRARDAASIGAQPSCAGSSPPPHPPATSTRTSSSPCWTRAAFRRPDVNVRPRALHAATFAGPSKRVILEADSKQVPRPSPGASRRREAPAVSRGAG